MQKKTEAGRERKKERPRVKTYTEQILKAKLAILDRWNILYLAQQNLQVK